MQESGKLDEIIAKYIGDDAVEIEEADSDEATEEATEADAEAESEADADAEATTAA
jgi:hypothetical protein